MYFVQKSLSSKLMRLFIVLTLLYNASIKIEDVNAFAAEGSIVNISANDALDIPLNTVDVKALSVTITAPADAALDVYGVNISYAGMEESDIREIRVTYSNGKIISAIDRFTNSKAYIDFGNSFISLSAGQSVNLDVRFTLNDYAESNIYHKIYVSNYSDINSNLKVNGSYPVYGRDIDTLSSKLDEPVFIGNNNAKIIERDGSQVIGEFSIQNASSKPISLYSINLENNGTLNFDNAIEYIYLKDASGARISTVIENPDGNELYFNIGGYIINANTTVKFAVYGDIQPEYVDSADMIELTLNSDFDGYSVIFYYSDAGDAFATSYSEKEDSLGKYDIEDSYVLTNISKYSPSVTNISSPLSTYKPLVWDMSVNVDTNVNKFTVQMDAQLLTISKLIRFNSSNCTKANFDKAFESKFTNVTLNKVNTSIDDYSSVSKTLLYTGDNNNYTVSFVDGKCVGKNIPYVFTDKFSIDSSDTMTMHLTMDITSKATNGETFAAKVANMNDSSLFDFEEVYNGDRVQDIYGEAIGYTQSIKNK